MAVSETSTAPLAAPAGASPLFSFVLICWNHEQFVGDTLESISSQDYPNWECLAIDNGSADGSRTILERHAAADPRFRFHAIPENIGQLGAALKSLDDVSGEFICFADSDDILFPNFASAHVRTRAEAGHPNGISNGRIVEIAHEGSLLSGSIRPGFGTAEFGSGSIPRLPAFRKIDAREITVPLNPGTSNVYSRADVMRSRLLAPPRLMPRQAADNLFFRSCHALSGSLLIERPLSAYRITGSNEWAAYPAMLRLNRSRPETDRFFETQRLEQAAQFVRHRKKFLGELYREKFWPALQSLTADSEAQFQHRIQKTPLREAIAATREELIRDFGSGTVAQGLGERR